jgi:hypothetical protein
MENVWEVKSLTAFRLCAHVALLLGDKEPAGEKPTAVFSSEMKIDVFSAERAMKPPTGRPFRKGNHRDAHAWRQSPLCTYKASFENLPTSQIFFDSRREAPESPQQPVIETHFTSLGADLRVLRFLFSLRVSEA